MRRKSIKKVLKDNWDTAVSTEISSIDVLSCIKFIENLSQSTNVKEAIIRRFLNDDMTLSELIQYMPFSSENQRKVTQHDEDMTKLFEVHTEENGKDVDLGVYGVYADNEENAAKYAETEIATYLLTRGYRVETERTPEHSIVYAWNDEDVEGYRITIWVSQVE